MKAECRQTFSLFKSQKRFGNFDAACYEFRWWISENFRWTNTSDYPIFFSSFCLFPLWSLCETLSWTIYSLQTIPFMHTHFCIVESTPTKSNRTVDPILCITRQSHYSIEFFCGHMCVCVCACRCVSIVTICLRIERPTNAEWRETKLINWQDSNFGIWLDFLDLHLAKSVVFSVDALMMWWCSIDACLVMHFDFFFIVSTESQIDPKSMQKLIFTRLWSAFVSLIDVFGTHRFCSRIEFDVIGTWLPNHSMDAILIGLIDRNKNEKKVKRNRKFSGLLIIRKHHFRTNINWKVDQGPSISKRLTLTDHSLTHHIFFSSRVLRCCVARPNTPHLST